MRVAVGYGLDLNAIPGADKDALGWERLEDKEAFSSFLNDVETWVNSEDPVNTVYDFIYGSPKGLDDMIIYDDEFGLEDKLLLIPAGYMNSWVRYGNNLDSFIYEAQVNPNNWGEPEWTEKPGTLYPFVGLMKANPDKPLGVEKYWISCYLNDPEHRNATPYAPFHLWFLIKHLKIWPEDKTTGAFLSLRPTLYRFWS